MGRQPASVNLVGTIVCDFFHLCATAETMLLAAIGLVFVRDREGRDDSGNLSLLLVTISG